MVRGNTLNVKRRPGSPLEPPSGQGIKKHKRADPRYVALRLLAIRPRSIHELTNRLTQKGFSEAQVESVVRTLIEQGLLDDAQFARALVEQTVARKPVGRKLLLWKLRKAGVAPDLIEETLANFLPQDQELFLARAAASRKLQALTRRRPEAPKRDIEAHLGRFLLSRGFSADVVHAVLEGLGLGRI